MVKCIICNREFRKITNTHLLYTHKIYPSEFAEKFPNTDRGLMPWNKGKTKESHLSLLRLSNELKAKKEWNFSKWQRKRKKQQKIKYRQLIRDKNLAELVGVILGDGNLYKHPRTENLSVICSSKDIGYIQHIAGLIKKVFYKKPSIIKRKNENAIVISLYQCKISERLGIPLGDKIRNNVGIPSWISLNEKYMVKCLKGLFETDGCFQEDKMNYAQYIEFKNNCKRLREGVYNILLRLGYAPQFGRNYIRLAKRNEAYKFKELINFRNYSCPLG